MTFYFRVITPLGERKKGMIEAPTLLEAKAKLKGQGVIIISLKRKKNLLSSKKPLLKGEHLITFTSQLANLLSAGLPLYESLVSIADECRAESYHSLIIGLCEKIKSGESLSSAMSYHPQSFSALYCAMIKAGESVGSLSPALQKLSELLRKQNRLKKQLLTALIYPIILLSFSFLLILLLLIFVIPSLEALFEDRTVNRITHMIMFVSHIATRYPHIYIPLGASAIAALYYFIKKIRTKESFHLFCLKLPLLRSLIIQKEVARFTRAMGTLLKGGVNVISALQMARGVVSSLPLKESIAKAEKRIVEGSLLSEELKSSPWFPSLVSRMLSVGEEGGKMGDMLENIADIYEEEVEKTTTRLMTFAQPVILLIMGAIVGMIMMAILLPLTDVSAFIGG